MITGGQLTIPAQHAHRVLRELFSGFPVSWPSERLPLWYVRMFDHMWQKGPFSHFNILVSTSDILEWNNLNVVQSVLHIKEVIKYTKEIVKLITLKFRLFTGDQEIYPPFPANGDIKYLWLKAECRNVHQRRLPSLEPRVVRVSLLQFLLNRFSCDWLHLN